MVAAPGRWHPVQSNFQKMVLSTSLLASNSWCSWYLAVGLCSLFCHPFFLCAILFSHDVLGTSRKLSVLYSTVHFIACAVHFLTYLCCCSLHNFPSWAFKAFLVHLFFPVTCLPISSSPAVVMTKIAFASVEISPRWGKPDSSLQKFVYRFSRGSTVLR